MATSVGSAGSIDVNGIVSQLMAIERQGLNKFNRREAAYTTQISAWSGIKGSISNLQGTLAALNNLTTYQAATTTLSRPEHVSAVVQATATPGTHTVAVNQLASAHRVATAAIVGGASTVVGGGTLTFQFGGYDAGLTTFTVNGSRPTAAVTIAPGASVRDVANAVNTANVGVSASIVNDGSGDRLIFASKFTGAANSLNIGVTDDDGVNTDATGLSQFAYDPPGGVSNLSLISAGVNAEAVVNGLLVSSESNVLDRAIEGLTINLLRAGVGIDTTITVERGVGTIRAAIDSFVRGYNDAMKTVNDALKYDPATKRAGALNGDASLQALQGQLRNTVMTPLALVPGDYASLAEVGIRLGVGGQLTVDSTKLNAALTGDSNKVARLLARTGASDSPGVKYKTSTANTAPGLFDVELLANASRGSLLGSSAANLTIVAGINDSLDVGIDGVAATITLNPGTYASAAALAADLQSRINGMPGMSAAGAAVTVTESAGVLQIVSNRYGVTSAVTISGSAATDLFGGAPTLTTGTDAAGLIGGVDAIANGRTLTGQGGAQDLAIELGDGLTPGGIGTVRVYDGFASRMERMLTRLSATTSGLFQSRLNGLDRSVKQVQKDRTAMESRLQTVEANYRRQYDALNVALTRMQSTSTYLEGQLKQIAVNNGSLGR